MLSYLKVAVNQLGCVPPSQLTPSISKEDKKSLFGLVINRNLCTVPVVLELENNVTNVITKN